jgi:hypothetical protein
VHLCVQKLATSCSSSKRLNHNLENLAVALQGDCLQKTEHNKTKNKKGATEA